MTRRRLTEQDRLRIQRALKLRPHSYKELQAITGLKHGVMSHHIRNLREQNIVYVGAWGREGDFGTHFPLFAWGNEADSPRPPALTAAQRMAKSRAARSKA